MRPRTRKRAAASSRFGISDGAFPADPDAGPSTLRTLGLAVLAEELRPETRETIAFLLEQGVEIVVLSGDAARTVGSIATDAGIPALEAPARRRGAPGERRGPRPRLGLAVGRRPHLAGRKAAGRRVAPPQRALRGDGRGRGQRRPGAEGVAALDRAGLGSPDGQGRLRRRARQRRLSRRSRPWSPRAAGSSATSSG